MTKQKYYAHFSFLVLRLWNYIRLRKVDTALPLKLRAAGLPILQSPDSRSEYLEKRTISSSGNVTSSKVYQRYKNNIDVKLSYFDSKWFQCGGLDDEIDLIIDLAEACRARRILEIGVANGYSSAMLYKYAEMVGNCDITSIDLPNFEPQACDLTSKQRMIQLAASEGLIESTGTLIDIKPGGIIPNDKWGGWLVDPALRESVGNRYFVGDVFSLICEFGIDEKFDVIVVDAMKDYVSRVKLLNDCYERVESGGVIVLDGAWLNSAFTDFCMSKSLAVNEIGRIAWARKD